MASPVVASSAGETVIASVIVDEASFPAGHIVAGASGWRYELGAPGVVLVESTVSRQDLERLIALFHLGAAAPESAITELPAYQLAG